MPSGDCVSMLEGKFSGKVVLNSTAGCNFPSAHEYTKEQQKLECAEQLYLCGETC